MDPNSGLLANVRARCLEEGDRVAFRIAGGTHSYAELSAVASSVRSELLSAGHRRGDIVAFVARDDFETYGAILGILFAGCAYTPMNPRHPRERNVAAATAAGVRTLLTSGSEGVADLLDTSGMAVVDTTRLALDDAIELGDAAFEADDLAYLLFTSGSTGKPKGVPITHGNLDAFSRAFAASGCVIERDDRVLQMFDLTFDLSVVSYLAPLSVGASVCPVPSAGMKFGNVYTVLEQQEVTAALMVPSMLQFLKPYFDDIDLPKLRYSFFCGEALHADVLDQWARCVPNAKLQNFYGPTEATIYCTYYDWDPTDEARKAERGVVSIGRPMKGMHAVVVDTELRPVAQGQKGELCVAGPLVTRGYWNDAEKTERAFFELDEAGESRRFYRTGDVVYEDPAGDIFYVGRVDHQIQVQGFRVELSEIEFHARRHLEERSVAVVSSTNASGVTELHLFAEGEFEHKPLIRALRAKLPGYMVPSSVRSVERLPLNTSGKIDRPGLVRLVEKGNAGQ